MKVGILTFHDGINHGAFLQAYCLQETLKKFGVDVRIINYKSRYHYVQEYSYFLGSPKLYLRPRSLKGRLLNLSKIIKFKLNHRLFQLTRFSHAISECTENENFDVVVLGSDEIWNFKNPLVGIDTAYFGGGVKAKRVISYAASFGQISPQDKIPVEIDSCLRDLSNISVRDDNSLEILKCLLLSAQKVLDPTFLHNIQPPSSYKKPFNYNYILVYLNFIAQEDIAFLQEYAYKHGKKLVAISYGQHWCERSIVSLDVFEWLNFFKHADAVITNTFHGTIYSILYEKKFMVLNPGTKSNKIDSLLNDLELVDRKVVNARGLSEKLEEELNYEKVAQRLDERRDQSLKYLYQAIFA